MTQDIELATKLQKVLQDITLEWWTLDQCLEIVRKVWNVDTRIDDQSAPKGK